jgi:hypothetical protein
MAAKSADWKTIEVNVMSGALDHRAPYLQPLARNSVALALECKGGVGCRLFLGHANALAR